MSDLAAASSVIPVVATAAPAIGGDAGLAGLCRERGKPGERIGQLQAGSDRCGRPIATWLHRRHLITWRVDCRERRPHGPVDRPQFVIPYRLHERTESSEIVSSLVAERRDDGVASLICERKRGEAAGFGKPTDLDLLPGQSRHRAVSPRAIDEIVAGLSGERDVGTVCHAVAALHGYADRHNTIHVIAQRAIGSDDAGPGRTFDNAAIDAAGDFLLAEAAAELTAGRLRAHGTRGAEQIAAGPLVIETDGTGQRRAGIAGEARRGIIDLEA